jgi:hypothetical protein
MAEKGGGRLIPDWVHEAMQALNRGNLMTITVPRRAGKTAAAAMAAMAGGMGAGGGAGGSGGTGVIGISPLGWTRMAHPIWPYGTVIRPSMTNAMFHEDTRHMVVGRQSRDPRALVAIDLRTETPYAHLLEDIEDRWEVEEEAP